MSIFVPVNHPWFMRHTVCQMMLQTRKPDTIAIHQNGLLPKAEWAVSDVIPDSIEKYFRYTSGSMVQPEFYTIPLMALFKLGCTHFAKVDDDDIFYPNHLETLIKCFDTSDVVVQDFDAGIPPNIVTPAYGDVLEPKLPRIKNIDWGFNPSTAMSDSVMFDRKFAEAYIDLMQKRVGDYDDVLMGELIRSGRFKQARPTHDATACYVINGENTSGDLRGNSGYIPQKEYYLREKMKGILKTKVGER